LPTTPRIYVCRGEDCRKRKKHGRALCDALQNHGDVIEVTCQKICKGPVFGLEVAGRLEWFSRLRTARSRRSAIALVRDGAFSGRIKRHRERKRRGKLRGEANFSAQAP
jgi:hypothetical protein